MRHRFVIVVTLAVLAVLASLARGAEPPAGGEMAAIFDRANAAFRRGLELSSSHPQDARVEFARAAAGYETLAASVRSESLLTNLGNACLLAGDTGRAVLNYRRALRLAPAHAGAQAGLSAARQRVGVAAPSRDPTMLAWTTAWRAFVPAPVVWAVATVAWAAGWALLTFRVGRARLAAALALCWGVAAVGGTLHLLERWVDRASGEAVVVRDGVTGLNGPAAGVYQPSFDKPLAAGVEVRVLERRAGWARVTLADGRETWVPAEAVEPV